MATATDNEIKQVEEIQDLKRQLAEAEKRYKEVTATIARMEQQLKMLKEEAQELFWDQKYGSHRGKIQRLRDELQRKTEAYDFDRWGESATVVRVRRYRSGDFEKVGIIRTTPKRLYYKPVERGWNDGIPREEFCNLNAGPNDHGYIMPEDMEIVKRFQAE